MMATVCCVCNRVLRDGRSDCPFSHGICLRCMRRRYGTWFAVRVLLATAWDRLKARL